MNKTPDFQDPPINEIACGIQFDLIDWDFLSEHQIYNEVKREFNTVEKHPPLAQAFDKLSKSATNTMNTLPPFFRYYFLNDNKDKLIQLQNGRYLFNWRKTPDRKNVYPHFSVVYKEFFENWKKVSAILSKKNDKLKVNQFELTKVNHFFLDDFGIDKGEFYEVMTIFKNSNLLKKSDVVDTRFAMPIPELNGHISVTSKTANRNKDKKDIIVMELTVRGLNEIENIENWFLVSNNKINEIFLESITDKAKVKWGYNA